MMISQQTIQSVQSAVRIEEVIAEFVTLKKRGQNFWACCPFHQENTPSFSVSSVKGFYKCFGCDAAGDAITFVQQIEGLTFVEAVTYLAQKYGIPIVSVQENRNDMEAYRAKESLYIVLNLARDYYSDLLWNHVEGAKCGLFYLEQRSIERVIAKKFELGYSLNSWDGFYKFATNKGITLDQLVQAGLVIQNEAKVYDRFRGRLMFPIHDSSGQVVAFGAREMVNAVDSPKYVNSCETLVYQKSKLVYGLSFAKHAIKQNNNCYLVEGYTDVLAFHKANIEHVVASAGTALTGTQIDLLHRFTKKVTLVFDGDQAGMQATFRGIDQLLVKGFEVKVIVLPTGQDPDSYLCELGSDSFSHYINCATQDFITFKAGFLLNQATQQSPVEQAKTIRDIVQTITAIPDEIQRVLFLKKCSTMFSLEEEVIFSTYYGLVDKTTSGWQKQKTLASKYHKQKEKQHQYLDQKNIPFNNKLTASIQAYEQEIMRILLNYGANKPNEDKKLYEYIFLELSDVVFRSNHCKKIFDYCKVVFEQGGVVDMQCCLDSKDESIRKIAIDLTASPHDISEAWIKKYGIYTIEEESNIQKMSLEVILRLKIRLIQELIEENREALKNNLSPDEENHLLQVHQALKVSECTIAKKLGTVVAQ